MAARHPGPRNSRTALLSRRAVSHSPGSETQSFRGTEAIRCSPAKGSPCSRKQTSGLTGANRRDKWQLYHSNAPSPVNRAFAGGKDVPV